MRATTMQVAVEARVQHNGADWRTHTVGIDMTLEQYRLLRHGSEVQKRMVKLIIEPLIIQQTGGIRAFVQDLPILKSAGDISGIPVPSLSQKISLVGAEHHCG
ncbi:hypothetical protein KW797_01350 [Candidatus Parcubacteria bacterium]|nr:hypothetical protein [Candidatus Parcubacteria bacterium]